MKKILLFLLLLSATSAFAQDVIVKKDGSTILSKVLKITANEVEYKKYSNQNGPTYTIAKAEIMRVKRPRLTLRVDRYPTIPVDIRAEDK